jgi:TPR repeat protein
VKLGVMYLEGQGVAKDQEKAVKWFRQAVEQGNALAQRLMGLMYEKAWGVEQDLEEAVKCYRRAAEQGDREAKKRLEQLAPE